MKNIRALALVASPLALALALVGCAENSDQSTSPAHHVASTAEPSPAVSEQHNDQDLMFAAMMIPHHEQAVTMSDTLLSADGVDQRVRDLAQQIKDAQSPQITQLKSWLAAWGASPSDSNGMSHGDSMMSEADLAALDSATGTQAARLYLQQMIVHHEGAVQMAQDELTGGSHGGALAMAQSIVDTQTREIETMNRLLAEL